jgi:hypothetical protein
MQNHILRTWLGASHLVAALALVAAVRVAVAENAATRRTIVTPKELPDAVLHNPDMGWVLYENYPVDQDPKGSSTLLALPGENFPEVDSVAVMFSWQDIEKQPNEYDFSKVDHAYEYWHRRGKAIQLRLSSESLLWWANRNPPAGKGVPDYVLTQLPPAEKQTRELDGARYVVVDARNQYYRKRLTKFLRAVNSHFSDPHSVTLIDFRGFGAWGEWHSGFKYPSSSERRDTLKGIIDLWSATLPNHRLALSYSFDPDGPKELHQGATDNFDESKTTHYAKFLYYSAFDYALTKKNIAFRRDGCGGAVHSNERKLNEEAFRLGRGPMFSEFIDGYAKSKTGDAKWINWKVDDALSLHPNYVSLLGWQGGDALNFIKERADLIKSAVNRMGYRLVPTRIEYPTELKSGRPLHFEIRWVNRGVGRALRDYDLRLCLIDSGGRVTAKTAGGTITTSRWVAGEEYPTQINATFANVPIGKYRFAIGLYDSKSKRAIELPIAQRAADGLYRIGSITCEN